MEAVAGKIILKNGLLLHLLFVTMNECSVYRRILHNYTHRSNIGLWRVVLQDIIRTSA